MNRGRWYDIPFSRDESLQADKKVNVIFGPSQDPETVTMLDSIKVLVFADKYVGLFYLVDFYSRYGKTKESFGWPDEADEAVATSASTTVPAMSSSNDGEPNVVNPLPVTKLER